MHRTFPTALATVLAVAAVGLSGPAARAGPEDDKSYRAGIGLLSKGVHDLAATELRNYLQQRPDGRQVASARYALAVCLVKLEKYEEAAGELDRVVDLEGFEFAPDAMLLRAQCSVAAGDDTAAAKMLERLLNAHPDFAQTDRATALYGESLYRAGRIDQSIGALGSVGRRWPGSASAERAQLFLGLAEIAAGDYRAAADHLAALRSGNAAGPYAFNSALAEAQCRHRLGDLKEASRVYGIAAEATDQGMKSEALLGRAQVERAQGNLEQAQHLLSDLLATNPPEVLAVSARLEQGRLLLDGGDAPAAGRALADIAESAPTALADDAAYWSAKCEIKLGKFGQAAEHLSAAAEKWPGSELLPDMLFDRAVALTRGGDDAAALPAWSAWQTRFPRHELLPEALVAQAGCAHRLAKYDQSLELCEQFLKRFPDHPRAPVAELLAAENHYLADRFEQAEGAYGEFIKRHPGDPSINRAQIRRGLCMLRLGRDADGSRALEQAITNQSDQDPALRAAAISALGDHFFSAGDWNSAEHWFLELSRSAKGQPEEPDVLLRLGLSIQRQARPAESVPMFERVISLAPDSTQALHARFEKGQALVQTGEFDDARKCFDEVVSAEETAAKPVFTAPALRHLAAIASRQGRPEEAATILATLSDSGDQAALLQQGSAWLSAGRYDLAERVYSTFIDRLKGRDSGQTAEARARRAIAINRQGRSSDALKELDSITSQAAGLDPELVGNIRYERALALCSLDRGDEASEAYLELLNSAIPVRLEAYAALDLAQLECRRGRYDQAIALLDRCRAAATKAGGTDAARILDRETYSRGVCLMKLGKHVEAAEALQSYESKFPKSDLVASADLVLGEALLNSGHAAEAASELRRLIESGPPRETTVSAMLLQGDALAAAQQWSQSEEAFTAFLDRFADHQMWFQARFGQGWARENQGRQDAAVEAYRDVVARHQGPTAARAQFQIGECLYALKRHDQAVGELLKVDVLYAYPQWSAAALYEAGRCLAEMGRAADSAHQFDDLVRRFPDTQWAQLARQRRDVQQTSSLSGQAQGSVKPR